MSEIYFLGTTRSFGRTEFKLKYQLPRMEKDEMLYNDSIFFEENLSPDELATGVQKILKGCHIYSVKTTLGLDYEVRYERVYGAKTARTLIEILRWFRDSIISIVANGGKAYLIKLWQGREISPKEVKRQEIKTDEWLITGGGDIIFDYGTLYEFTCTPPDSFSPNDMEYTLKEFADCDSFSLSAIWKAGWLLTEEQAAHALGVYEQISAERCKRNYDDFSDEKRREYPDFNALWESFKKKYAPVGREWQLLPDGPEKYKKVPRPDGVSVYLGLFWACALELGMHGAQIELFKAVGAAPPEEELLTGEYAALRPHLIKVLPSFFHHCSNNGVFRCHFVFALNDDTRAWLAQFPVTDCFTMPLEDFALYKGGEIKFSCCSHEGIYNKINEPRKGII